MVDNVPLDQGADADVVDDAWFPEPAIVELDNDKNDVNDSVDEDHHDVFDADDNDAPDNYDGKNEGTPDDYDEGAPNEGAPNNNEDAGNNDNDAAEEAVPADGPAYHLRERAPAQVRFQDAMNKDVKQS